jgi:hypothetical protein
MIIILERILELCIGIITIISFRQKFRSGGLSQKDLLARIEKQDREIERLKMQRHFKTQHNYRAMHRKSKHALL